MRSRFCLLSTVGPEGTDGSPRGDDGAVVQIPDSQTILLPDWRGNNRVDSLRNIVRDGRLSLMFLLRGVNVAVRVNGRGALHTGDICERFEQQGRYLCSVIVVLVGEVYSQCSRATDHVVMASHQHH